ncbi:F-box only protein 36b [Notolabrus celidotus]|uniref:F-box only protein 36b n=1 Tax=Notolabrus celidotus TaxID=1203425 RepID=UPI00148F9932|nr:F-box only protein 36b [Notolabrus celidotus]
MASLLTEPLFEISGQGPPPDKTFYHFSITKSQMIWRWWQISLRAVDRNTRPGELKQSHQDFLDDTEQQSEVRLVFGRRILQYTTALCQGHYDYLQRLPESLLLYIMRYLELEDVSQLGQTSRRFRQLCWSEGFWEQAMHRHCNTVPAEVASLAVEVGWRRIFFTSKLQLQKLLSRRRAKAKEEQEVQISIPDTKVEKSPDESSEKDHVSGPDLDSLPGIIPDQSLGTETGTGFDTSACCDADPNPCPEADTGSEFSLLLSSQMMPNNKKGLDEIQEPDEAPSSGRGDSSA